MILGIFDSGLGGLTVLREIIKNNTYDKIIYFGDTQNLPYGEKDKETLLKMTRFNSDESALRFAKKLKNLGVDDELKALGAKEGDTVRILDQEFEYEERLY